MPKPTIQMCMKASDSPRNAAARASVIGQ
jgi:hypothetical protein